MFCEVSIVHFVNIFLLFSVTENHPEVQALVVRALEEARHMSTAPDSLYTEVLLQRVKEVHQKIITFFITTLPTYLSVFVCLQMC